MEKPFSAACDRNKDPILEILKVFVSHEDRRLLEIGSGTGQHAVHMAPHFPFLEWYPTDVSKNLLGMKLWFKDYPKGNIQVPTRLEIGKDEFPKLKFDLIYTANTFHIMHWKECKTLMKMMGHRLREGSRVFVYGPFKYNGEFTSESNAHFDSELRLRDPLSGIRAFEDVLNAMIKNGFELLLDSDMPANNRMLVFKRLKFQKGNS
jgi:cyclopropane fatty-acyl-phospholipid synthase-like methyltransferase